jgi:hypothetical protein
MHGGLCRQVMIDDVRAGILRDLRGDDVGGQKAAHRSLAGDA